MYKKEKFRGRQAELGLSVAELAERAGVDPNTVSAIRNGKAVRTVSLQKVMNALGLTPAEVFVQPPEPETVGST